jgi:hypothetical protein
MQVKLTQPRAVGMTAENCLVDDKYRPASMAKLSTRRRDTTFGTTHLSLRRLIPFGNGHGQSYPLCLSEQMVGPHIPIRCCEEQELHTDLLRWIVQAGDPLEVEVKARGFSWLGNEFLLFDRSNLLNRRCVR